MGTKIPWTEVTWNPVVGCTKVSAGGPLPNNKKSQYVYSIGPDKKWNGFVNCIEDELDKPLHWKKPRKIFVCSMGDLFHPQVPCEFVGKVIMTAFNCPQHTFQILTKRIERAAGLCSEKVMPVWTGLPALPDNVWLGTSISTQADADKNIPILLQIPAAVRFVSLEPMLERIDLYLSNSRNDILWRRTHGGSYEKSLVDWVIIGCESGPKARLCSLDDIDYVIRQCEAAGVPIFLKQIPLNGKGNKNPDEWPEKYRRPILRQYPKQGSEYGKKENKVLAAQSSNAERSG